MDAEGNEICSEEMEQQSLNVAVRNEFHLLAVKTIIEKTTTACFMHTSRSQVYSSRAAAMVKEAARSMKELR